MGFAKKFGRVLPPMDAVIKLGVKAIAVFQAKAMAVQHHITIKVRYHFLTQHCSFRAIRFDL
jgi:hypothetical protein